MLNQHYTGAGASRPHGPFDPAQGRTQDGPGRPASRRGRVLASDWTAEQDDLIRWAYSTRSLADRRARVPVVKAKTGRTNEQCYCRALQIGCAYPITLQRKAWTAAEDALLERFAYVSLPAMSKRLKKLGHSRSESAIADRRWKLGINCREARRDAGIYTAEDAAEVLGVGSPRVGSFIQRGWLKAKKTGDATSNAWRITARDLRAFVIHYTAHVRFDKADKYFLVELLCPLEGIKRPGHDATVGVEEVPA